jgi:hypothetical protein
VDLIALPYLNELRTGWLSYFQLIQELIDGATRRHTFTAWELDLMLDLEVSRLRKSSRPEVLRRYLRFVQAESLHTPQPTRFSAFMETETLRRRAAKAANSG